ncbi:universal stress protein [Actinomycetospora rhizophila]|uniref:Universal stress protein n=1 Tax=Actinomycetospora rhizophila TaxID=1416876 RepID=A0ABV9ZFH1_9PSEU
MTGRSGVVVGLDGSPAAAAALAAALEEGARRGEPVTAVMAFPAAGSWADGEDVPDLPEPDRLTEVVEDQARRFAEEATMPLSAALREVPCEVRVHPGSPAPVLAEAARNASLLVVGHRGRGPLGSAVLGSTGLRVLALATCPVLVVRPREEAADGPVVVGVDRSDGSAAALRHALDDAVLRGVRVVVVTGVAPPPTTVGFRPLPGPTLETVREGLRPRVERFVRRVVDEHAAGHPVPPVDVVVRAEDPTMAVVDVAEQVRAPVLVVGRTGHGALARWLIGSVAHGAVLEAPCAVVVVPPEPAAETPAAREEPACDDHRRQPTVVVGVDGSPGADAALRHAVGEARRRGGRVHAVAACDSPALGAIDVESLPVNPEQVRESTERRARQHTAEVLREVGGDVPVEVHARLGRPTPVLVGAAHAADLLVVGHRGRGPVRSALLGSVGLGCVLHAPCPVTVVRAEPVDGDGSPPPGAIAVSS